MTPPPKAINDTSDHNMTTLQLSHLRTTTPTAGERSTQLDLMESIGAHPFPSTLTSRELLAAVLAQARILMMEPDGDFLIGHASTGEEVPAGSTVNQTRPQ